MAPAAHGADSIQDPAAAFSIALPADTPPSVATSFLADLGSIPASAMGGDLGAAGLEAAPLASIPLMRIPVSHTPLASLPILRIPLARLPLARIPILRIALAQVPLARIPILRIAGTTGPNTWQEMIIGTPLADAPFDSLTLADLLEPTNYSAQRWVELRDAFESLTLGEVDLSATVLGSLPLWAIAMADVPISQIPITGDQSSTPAQNLNAWCAFIESNTKLRCADDLGIDVGDVDSAANEAVNPLVLGLASVPILRIPILRIPILRIPILRIPILQTPILRIGLASTPLAQIPILRIDLASLGVACPPADRPDYDCQATTLAQAASDGLIPPDLTTAALLGALDEELRSTLTLADVLAGFVDPSNITWPELKVSDPALSAANTAPDAQDLALKAEVPQGATAISLDLPAGWGVVSASSGTRSGGIGAGSYATRDAEGLARLTFPILPGPAIFMLRAGYAAPGADLNASVAGPDGLTIATSVVRLPVITDVRDTGDSDPATATALDARGQLAIATDSDARDIYSVDVASGERLAVSLGGFLADLDVVVFGPIAPTSGGPVDTTWTTGATTATQIAEGETGLFASDSRVPAELLADTPLISGLPVVAASLQRGATSEAIETHALPGGRYLVQVTGYGGTPSGGTYGLRVISRPTIAGASCATRTNMTVTGFSAPGYPLPTTTTTDLLVVNSERMAASFGAAAGEVSTALSQLALNNERGHRYAVLDLGTDSAIKNLYRIWDSASGRCKPSAANDIVKAVVARIRAIGSTSLGTVTLVGADDQIPMARLFDPVATANEQEYSWSFLGGDELSAAMGYGMLFSDDPYSTAQATGRGGASFFVPDHPVGRLVESPAEIAGTLQRFLGSDGTLDANTAAVTGYDFLSDGATAVADGLAGQSAFAVDRSMISDSWTGGDLRSLLARTDVGVLSVNAHFDHNRALPAADNAAGTETGVVSTDAVTGSPGVALSMGCHSGLNISDASIVLPGTNQTSDWPQAFAARSSALVGNTGYGLADTDLVAYSESLMAKLAYALGSGDSLGEAWMVAKHRYIAELASVSSYDVKASEEMVLFGLPFWEVGARASTSVSWTGSSLSVSQLSASTSVLRELTTDLGPAIDPALSFRAAVRPQGTLWQLVDHRTTGWGAGAAAPVVVAGPNRPAQPAMSLNVTVSGYTARGVYVTALASHDVATDPIVSRPSAGGSASEPFLGDAPYPAKIQSLGTGRDESSRRDQALLTMGQFRPTGDSVSGIERLYDRVRTRVFYSASTRAAVAAPTIDSVSATGDGAVVRVSVASPNLDVARGNVMWTDADRPGTWTQKTLSRSGTSWVGTIDAPSGVKRIEFFTQLVGTEGAVAVASNKGSNYTIEVAPDRTPPLVAFTTRPTEYGTEVDIVASDSGSGVATLALSDSIGVSLPTTVEADHASLVIPHGSSTTVKAIATDASGNVGTGSYEVTGG